MASPETALESAPSRPWSTPQLVTIRQASASQNGTPEDQFDGYTDDQQILFGAGS